MSTEALEELMDRWMNDSVFREELRRDPEGTVAQIGLSLTPDEVESLLSMDAEAPGEVLEPRISRS